MGVSASVQIDPDEVAAFAADDTGLEAQARHGLVVGVRRLAIEHAVVGSDVLGSLPDERADLFERLDLFIVEHATACLARDTRDPLEPRFL